MQEQEVELVVGDVVQLGEIVVVVMDIDGDDVSFRIEGLSEGDAARSFDDAPSRRQHLPAPR